MARARRPPKLTLWLARRKPSRVANAALEAETADPGTRQLGAPIPQKAVTRCTLPLKLPDPHTQFGAPAGVAIAAKFAYRDS
jgi:hypothetical protein